MSPRGMKTTTATVKATRTDQVERGDTSKQAGGVVVVVVVDSTGDTGDYQFVP